LFTIVVFPDPGSPINNTAFFINLYYNANIQHLIIKICIFVKKYYVYSYRGTDGKPIVVSSSAGDELGYSIKKI
jgi:hypothetical protein